MGLCTLSVAVHVPLPSLRGSQAQGKAVLCKQEGQALSCDQTEGLGLRLGSEFKY